jgi:hypothetical protein
MTERTKFFIARAIGYGLICGSVFPDSPWRCWGAYTGLCMIDIWRKP